MDVVEVARSLVRKRFPTASVALLTGSAARGRINATSDLDIVVVVPGLPRAYREADRVQGRLVELFVNNPASLRDFVDTEIPTRRSPLLHMCAHSVLLLPTEEGRTVQNWARELYDNGPPPLNEEERLNRRYLLSAALDDLTDAVDPQERACIASDAFLAAAELLMASLGVWFGRGKWLARQLLAADETLGRELLAAHGATLASGDPASLLAAARQVLESVGGWLQEGYRQEAPPPAG